MTTYYRISIPTSDADNELIIDVCDTLGNRYIGIFPRNWVNQQPDHGYYTSANIVDTMRAARDVYNAMAQPRAPSGFPIPAELLSPIDSIWIEREGIGLVMHLRRENPQGRIVFPLVHQNDLQRSEHSELFARCGRILDRVVGIEWGIKKLNQDTDKLLSPQ